MKNYIIAFLVTATIVLGTFIYKLTQSPVLVNFPIQQQTVNNPGGEPPLYLFLFFSRQNCTVCLEAIQVLNELPSPFVVTGIVPAKELDNENDLRTTTGATFKLIPFKASYRKHNPHYLPTLFGVSGRGRILFVLPGVPGEKDYLYNFLATFYGRSLEMLISESREHS